MSSRHGQGLFIALLGLFPSFACGPSTATSSSLQAATLVAPLTSPPHYPIKLGPSGSRYLVDQDDRPFFWSGEAAWSLVADLTLADAQSYLDDRMTKGINVVMVNLIEHKFGARAPANIYGDAPFTGRPFATPNDAYFTRADAIIQAAGARGMTVLLAPIYLGFNCGSEGWCAEVNGATLAEMRSWGQYVGRRYGAYDNVVWLIGGDTDPTPVLSRVRECVNGIRDFDTRHLMTAHSEPESYAATHWPGEAWLTINNLYTYSTTLYGESLTAYQSAPVMPFFMIESAYENEHNSTPQSLRAQAYWPVLMGGMGHIFGNCPIWNFGSTTAFCSGSWTANLGSAGSKSMMYVQQIFNSRPWYMLVPDVNHTALTAGYGTYGSTSYVVAARASNGATIMAYLPSARQVTVDLARVSGASANAWWFNPGTGAASSAGTFPTSGPQTFTPPGSGDWVLAVDDAAWRFRAPGSPPVSAAPTVASAASASPNPTVGPTSTVSVLGADDGGESTLMYAWSAVAVPSGGAVTFSLNGTNAAKSSTATFTTAGQYVLSVAIVDAEGQSATSRLIVNAAANPTADTVVSFEDLADGFALRTYGGIAWGASGGGWNVWNGGPVYTNNAYVNSTSKTEVTASFTLPAGKVLKSVKIAVGSGGAATVKLSSPGNPEQAYTGINGTYGVKTLNWTAAADVITVKITCATPDGASDLAFDDFVYGSVSGSANQAPTVSSTASATPTPVTGTTATLSVLGADDGGEPGLTYTWSVASAPLLGSATFSANGTNASKSTMATFTAAGSYTLSATLRDVGGLSAASGVNLIVQPRLTAASVTPSAASVLPNAAQQFTATGKDQFGRAFSQEPTFAWSTSGGGTISSTGLFTAGATSGGPFSVMATSAGVSGTAAVTVSATADASVNFESLTEGAVLSVYGGITWGPMSGGWKVWNGGTTYTKNAYVDSIAKSEATATFTLPTGKVLKSLKIAVGSGGTATVKLISSGNPERDYTDINGTYSTKTLNWTTAAEIVTVKVTCATPDGASDLAFDDIVYGVP